MEEPRISLKEAYTYAREYVIQSGYSDEIYWQKNICFDDIQESDFLRESAWVILSSGMKETIVRKYFNNISSCFFEWESAKVILKMERHCYESAIEYFNNPRKILAIIKVASQIDEVGFYNFKNMIKIDTLDILQELPFIGPVTSCHLAKNIGLPVAKEDRHMERLVKISGYDNAQEFCRDISIQSGDSIPVVDIVLWRFATLENDYLKIFSNILEYNGEY